METKLVTLENLKDFKKLYDEEIKKLLPDSQEETSTFSNKSLYLDIYIEGDDIGLDDGSPNEAYIEEFEKFYNTENPTFIVNFGMYVKEDDWWSFAGPAFFLCNNKEEITPEEGDAYTKYYFVLLTLYGELDGYFTNNGQFEFTNTENFKFSKSGDTNSNLNLADLGLKEVKVIFNGEFENVDFWTTQYKKLIDVNESDLTISWGNYSGNGCAVEVNGGNYIGPDVEEGDAPSLRYNEFNNGIQLFNLQNWAGPIQITVTPTPGR